MRRGDGADGEEMGTLCFGLLTLQADIYVAAFWWCEALLIFFQVR